MCAPATTVNSQSSIFASLDCEAFRSLASIALPLTKLQSDKEDFVWGTDAQEAFGKLKAALCSAPVLRIYDPDKPIRVVVGFPERPPPSGQDVRAERLFIR